MGRYKTMSMESDMKRWTVELRAEARKYVKVVANSYSEAMDKAADSVDSSDTDLGDWEIMRLTVDDAEEYYEEDYENE
jgi:hypothetical protein